MFTATEPHQCLLNRGSFHILPYNFVNVYVYPSVNLSDSSNFNFNGQELPFVCQFSDLVLHIISGYYAHKVLPQVFK